MCKDMSNVYRLYIKQTRNENAFQTPSDIWRRPVNVGKLLHLTTEAPLGRILEVEAIASILDVRKDATERLGRG